MKTELLNIFEIAQIVASIAKGETKRSLTTEIVKLTMYLQIKEPVYILYNRKEKLAYVTMSKAGIDYGKREGYELIIIIENSKELNKYKVQVYE